MLLFGDQEDAAVLPLTLAQELAALEIGGETDDGSSGRCFGHRLLSRLNVSTNNAVKLQFL
jgi:hypothetical protein